MSGNPLLDALSGIGNVLSYPGQVVRGGLRSALSGFQEPFKLTSGQELLGLGEDSGLGGTLAGIGTDIATDPLTWLGGFLAKKTLGGASGAGRAAAVEAAPIAEATSPLARAITGAGEAKQVESSTSPLIQALQGGAEGKSLAAAPDIAAIKAIAGPVESGLATTPSLANVTQREITPLASATSSKVVITAENIDSHIQRLEQAWESMKKQDFAAWVKKEFGASVYGTKESMRKQASDFIGRLAVIDTQTRF